MAVDSKWSAVLRSCLVTLVCLYVPFSWLVLINYPWNDYEMFWLRLWPILPGFFAGIPFHPNDTASFTAMGIATAVLALVLIWLGSPGLRRLLLAAVIALLVSIPSSFAAHAVFRA